MWSVLTFCLLSFYFVKIVVKGGGRGNTNIKLFWSFFPFITFPFFCYVSIKNYFLPAVVSIKNYFHCFLFLSGQYFWKLASEFECFCFNTLNWRFLYRGWREHSVYFLLFLFKTSNQYVLADEELATTSYFPVKLKLQKTPNIFDVWVWNVFDTSRFVGKAQELLPRNISGKIVCD